MRDGQGVNILVTGSGSSGSWQVRGIQLGAAIGATVAPKALDVAAYDLVVVIKRPPADLVARIHAAGVPLVYDVVDAWPQPAGNAWSRDTCMTWLRGQIAAVRPAAIMAATGAMAKDCSEFGLPVAVLRHHARPGLQRNLIRKTVQAVGYEGAEHYLGRWRPIVEAECLRRGWRFVINPASLADVDIVLALRDATGYAPQHWKSNVKLANAQGSGTPFIGCREAGYLETAIGTCEKWASSPEELVQAFDALTPQAERLRVSGWMMAAAPQLDAVAASYRKWLEAACARAPKS